MQAAYGIAFLLILQLTDLTVIERSRKGTGVEFSRPISIVSTKSNPKGALLQ
ncbi:MAG: hypothetical protein VKJ24_13900 [Synechococcales bacterium]|nr:hypothetical protein [Synechococcales bacterium]